MGNGISYVNRRTVLGTGWRNATYTECLPRARMVDLKDLTEEIGYGFRFFRSGARSRSRKAALPLFAGVCWLLRRLESPPSLVLPYLNLVFQKRRDYEGREKQKCPGEVWNALDLELPPTFRGRSTGDLASQTIPPDLDRP